MRSRPIQADLTLGRQEVVRAGLVWTTVPEVPYLTIQVTSSRLGTMLPFTADRMTQGTSPGRLWRFTPKQVEKRCSII